MVGKILATFALVSAAVLGSSASAMAMPEDSVKVPAGAISHGSAAAQDWHRHCQWEWNRWQHRWVWDCDRYDYDRYQWRWHDYDRRWHWDNDRDWNEHHGHR
jgi:hypothetical protein